MDRYSGKMKGKTVVITGASSGAGRAMAAAFAAAGAQLVLAARRDEALNEVAAECKELGALAHIHVTDTRDAAQMKTLAAFAASLSGKVDVWVNNAGVLAAGALDEIPAEVNEAVVRTNLLGYIHGAHAIVPYFKRQGFGVLINNISVGGWFPTPYMAAYCASKFGLKGFSEALRGELKYYEDIHVCDLYPGFLDTPGIQHAANYTGKELKPSPPLYDPYKLAEQVVGVALKPRTKTTLGVFPVFLHLAYSIFPALSRNMTASMIGTYLGGAKEIEETSGNVLSPVAYGTGVYGGWKSTGLKPSPRKQLMLAAGILAGAVLMLRRW